MYINNKEKIKHIHTNENAIKELLKKLSENNEKIEVLNMQNKRISSEIASVEANIQNFQDTKKAHVAKKQFKEAQIANNEIKKSKENKSQLDMFLKGNLEEIEVLNNDNKETNKSIDDFNEEIKNLEKIIKEDNDKYLLNLLNILKQFIEDIEEDDPDKKMIEETIRIVTYEIYPNGEPKEQNTEIDKEQNNQNTENKEEEIKDKVEENKEGKEEKEEKEVNIEEKKEEKEEKIENEEKKEEKEETEEERIKREEEEKIKKKKEIKDLKEEIKELEQKLEILINEEKYDECDVTNTKIEELKAKLKKLEE